MAAILYSKIASMHVHVHVLAFIDTELKMLTVSILNTLIALRNNLHISFETEIRAHIGRTHIGRILILLSQPIQLLRVYEVLMKLIFMKIVLIQLMTFHLMIYDIKSHHWCNVCTKCTYNWTKLYVFHIYGGHFEYFKLLQGGNMP